VALGSLRQVSADPSPTPESEFAVKYETILKSVPSYELPAESASLVALAKADQKEASALAVIKVISKINPAAMPTVVGAISQSNSSLSARLAAEASKLQPKLASAIQTATVLVSSSTSGSATTAAATPVTTPTLSTGSTTGLPSPPVPPGTPGDGKKKGHYKNGVP